MLKHSKKAPGCCEWAACRRQKLPVSSNGDFGMSRLKESSWRTGYIIWTGTRKGTPHVRRLGRYSAFLVMAITPSLNPLSVPVPTFVSLCITLLYKRRNQRDTSAQYRRRVSRALMFGPMNSRRTRWAPSPLVGESWGEGLVGKASVARPPHPAAISSLCSALAADLSHKGRGEPSMLRRYHCPTPSAPVSGISESGH